MPPSTRGGSVVSATGEESLQSFDGVLPNGLQRPLRSHDERLSRGEKHHASLHSWSVNPDDCGGRYIMPPSTRGGSVVSATGEESLQSLDGLLPNGLQRPLRSHDERLSRVDKHASLNLRRVSRDDWGGYCKSRWTPQHSASSQAASPQAKNRRY